MVTAVMNWIAPVAIVINPGSVRLDRSIVFLDLKFRLHGGGSCRACG